MYAFLLKIGEDREYEKVGIRQCVIFGGCAVVNYKGIAEGRQWISKWMTGQRSSGNGSCNSLMKRRPCNDLWVIRMKCEVNT